MVLSGKTNTRLARSQSGRDERLENVVPEVLCFRWRDRLLKVVKEVLCRSSETWVNDHESRVDGNGLSAFLGWVVGIRTQSGFRAKSRQRNR